MALVRHGIAGLCAGFPDASGNDVSCVPRLVHHRSRDRNSQRRNYIVFVAGSHAGERQRSLSCRALGRLSPGDDDLRVGVGSP
jgi:hypothetical protein